MRINFQYVEYKNLMAVGNTPMRILLNKSPTTLLGGSNGSGKSTVFQAISYCLYGKFISDIKLANAINSINKKALVVECVFTKGEDTFKIIRGEKPKKFEIYKNDSLIDQKSSSRDQQSDLDLILGADFKAFCQHVILDMDRFVPFMKMNAADRRKVIDDVLDTSIYTEMSEVCKLKIKELTSADSIIDRKIMIKETEMQGKTNLIKQIQKQIDESKTNIQDEIYAKERAVADLHEQINEIQTELDAIPDTTAERYQTEKQKQELSKLGVSFGVKSETAKKNLAFYENNDSCPTCKQDLSSDLKAQKKHECDLELAEINKMLTEMTPLLQSVIEKQNELSEVAAKKTELEQNIRQKNNEIRYIQSDIASLKKSKTSVDETELDAAYQEYADLEKEKDLLTEELKEIMLHKEHYNKVLLMTRDDGIKSLIVKEYLPFFNKKVNEFLNAMNYFVGIKFDEQFNESFVSSNKENFQFENLSKGQKCRVNLAIWLALLEMASLKNSLVTNLLCLDEILEPFDAEGIRDFMLLCNKMMPDRNIFVITQRFEEFSDYFRSSIKFKLNNEFTEII